MKLGPYELDQIYTGDARELAREIPDGSVDLIFCDPPYLKEFMRLYEDIARISSRVLKPGCLLATICGHYHLPEALTLMTPHIDYHWIIAMVQPGGQAASQWPKKVIPYWKPIITFSRGKYSGQWFSDVLNSSINDKRFHEWGQSESGAAAVISRMSLEGQIVLDLFCGGGTVPAVCKKLNRRYLAFEIDPLVAEKARERVALTPLPLPFGPEPEQMNWIDPLAPDGGGGG